MEAWFVFAVIGFLQLLAVQCDRLPQCKGPHHFVKNPGECCKIPDLFEEKVFTDCGYPTLDEIMKNFHHVKLDCKKPICVLEKYKLSGSNEELDKEMFANTIDDWSDAHEDWKSAIEKVKDKCLADDLPGPPGACKIDKALMCTLHLLTENCPVWENSDDCTELKKHMEQCKMH